MNKKTFWIIIGGIAVVIIAIAAGITIYKAHSNTSAPQPEQSAVQAPSNVVSDTPAVSMQKVKNNDGTFTYTSSTLGNIKFTMPFELELSNVPGESNTTYNLRNLANDSVFDIQQVGYNGQQGDLGQWFISTKLKEMIESTGACPTSQDYLPVQLQPHQCVVIKKPGVTIVYLVGSQAGYETSSSIGDMVLVLEQDHAYIWDNPVAIEQPASIQAVGDAFTKAHPNAEFPDAEWQQGAQAIQQEIDRLITSKTPPKEVTDAMNSLSIFANSIEVSQ